MKVMQIMSALKKFKEIECYKEIHRKFQENTEWKSELKARKMKI